MDKKNQSHEDSIGTLKTRLNLLERKSRWYYSALDLVSSLGEIHRSSNHLEDPVAIFRESSPLLLRLAPFSTLSLFLVNPESARFECQLCDPPDRQTAVQAAVDHWIENGTFAWALKQPQALWAEGLQPGHWFLQGLATRSTVLGMIVAHLPEGTDRPNGDASRVLSIIVQHISQAMENARLFQKNREQNRELEELVKKRTQALEIKTVELEARIREVNDFTYLASHDLREPLRKLSLFGDRLKSHLGESIDKRTTDYLEIMSRAVRRLESQIDGLLNLSRITTEGRPIQKIGLDRVLEFAMNELALEIEDSSGVIEHDPLPTVYGDQVQMQQLFFHLLQNALLYRKEGVRPEIRVTAHKKDNGFWMIGFHDNGVGIPSTQQDKVFKPFEKLHARGNFAGAGMGLSICRKIVDRHGGTLRVESDPGKGASFFIELPEPG